MASNGLYLIIVFLGHIGGAAGPLPYDMQECRRRAADMAEHRDAAWKNPETARKLVEADPRVSPTAMRFVCEEMPARPALGLPWGGSVAEVPPEVDRAPDCEQDGETACAQ